MKKLILIIVMAFTIPTVFATHIIPIGYCGQYSYFKSDRFWDRSTILLYGEGFDTVRIYTGPMSHSDSIIKIKINPGVQVNLIYKFNTESNFNGPNIVKSANFQYADCGTLPVTLTNIYGTIERGYLKMNFLAGNESNMSHYIIQLSETTNNSDFVEVQTIKATGAKIYAANVSLGVKVASVAFLVFLTIGETVYKKRRLMYNFIVFFLIMTLVACKKDIEKAITVTPYKYMKVIPVSMDGVQESASVVKLEIK